MISPIFSVKKISNRKLYQKKNKKTMGKKNYLEQLSALIIDDDIDICNILKEFGEILGIPCSYITSPENLSETLSSKNFNIIFLDQNLPKYKGIDLIKKRYINPENYYIVLMTGDILSEEIINDLLRLGINEFIQKPIKLSDFKKAIFNAKTYTIEKGNFIEAAKRLEKSSIEFILDNNLSLIAPIAKMIIRNIEGLNFTSNTKILHTAIIEALTNAFIHGNLEIHSSIKEKGFEEFSKEIEKKSIDPKYKDRKIFISSYLDKKIFKVKIKDQGNGFNWKEYIKKLETDINFNVYGRGIKIIKNAFDEVYWNDVGNEIIMIKQSSASPIE